MKRILIDTNIYSHAFRGDAETISVLRRAEMIGICTVSIGELLSGFKRGTREHKNRKELEEFLNIPRVRVYEIDRQTSEFYAEILEQLKKTGKPIPTNDIWIAGVALQHGLKLFTKDRHFNEISGLTLIF